MNNKRDASDSESQLEEDRHWFRESTAIPAISSAHRSQIDGGESRGYDAADPKGYYVYYPYPTPNVYYYGPDYPYAYGPPLPSDKNFRQTAHLPPFPPRAPVSWQFHLQTTPIHSGIPGPRPLHFPLAPPLPSVPSAAPSTVTSSEQVSADRLPSTASLVDPGPKTTAPTSRSKGRQRSGSDTEIEVFRPLKKKPRGFDSACQVCRAKKLTCDAARPACAMCACYGWCCSYEDEAKRRGSDRQKRVPKKNDGVA